MANAADHALYGGLSGAATYLIMRRSYNRQPDFGEFLLCVGMGILGGMAPDAIEPADHPHHRQTAHSLGAAWLLLKLGDAQCGIENTQLTEFQKMLLASGIAGYMSHLVADGFTPRFLPLI